MKFYHDDRILQEYPRNYIAVLLCNKAYLRKGELTEHAKEFRASIQDNAQSILEVIEIWREVYSRMGTKKKYRSSLESLYKYFLKHGNLYEVSPVVDFYNAYSLSRAVSMGGFDFNEISGDVWLRKAKSGDVFIPLGSKQQISPRDGEIVYAVENTVICRCWNYQDSDLTKIKSSTEDVLFIVDIVRSASRDAHETYFQITSDFTGIFGGDIKHGLTGPESNSVVDLRA